MSAPSIKDLQEQGRTILIVRRPDLRVDVGDVSEMLRDEAVAMADVSIGTNSRQVSETFLDGASGDALELLAEDQFNTSKEDAVAAKGSVRFTRVDTAAEVTVPAGTRVATAADAQGEFQEYTTDIDLVLGIGTASGDVAATASDAGLPGNVAASKITRVLDTLDQAFTVTNPEKFAGGAPEQDDESLRSEARTRWRTQQRGTKEAVEFGAKQVSTVRVATGVEEASTQRGTLYVTDQEGNSNTEMLSDVNDELPKWYAFGAPPIVAGGELVSQTVVLSLTVATGVDTNALVARVRQAIVSAVNRLGVGETLYRGIIETAVRNVDRDSIVNVTITTPAANVEPSGSQLIRTTLDLVTVT